MTNRKKITLEQFIDIYNTYPPNKWIRFVFKYFSQDTERKNMKLKNWIIGVLLGLFGIGFIGTILNLSNDLIGFATFIYSILLMFLVFFILIGVWMNNKRINKIINLLGVTKQEYEQLIEKFF